MNNRPMGYRKEYPNRGFIVETSGVGIEELLRNCRITNFGMQEQRWRATPTGILDLIIGDLQREYYGDRLDQFKKETQVNRR